MEKPLRKRRTPITYIKDARTPTLLQHGQFDRRVPIAATWHDRQWFARHLWGEEVEIPLQTTTPER